MLLPSRELRRAVLAAGGETRLLEQLVKPFSIRLLARDREWQHDVLFGGEHRQQVEELEDKADVLPAQARQLAVVERGDLGAGDLDRALGRLVEPGEDVHERRLAGARRAHHGDELARLDTE